jgi:hypothetical protein
MMPHNWRVSFGLPSSSPRPLSFTNCNIFTMFNGKICTLFFSPYLIWINPFSTSITTHFDEGIQTQQKIIVVSVHNQEPHKTPNIEPTLTCNVLIMLKACVTTVNVILYDFIPKLFQLTWQTWTHQCLPSLLLNGYLFPQAGVASCCGDPYGYWFDKVHVNPLNLGNIN